MFKYTIPFRLPNYNDMADAINASRHKGNKLKQDTEADILWFLKPVCKISSPVIIRFTWYEQTAKRDKDNVAWAKKFILDAMQKAGILPNDNNRYIAGFRDDFVYHEGDKVVIEITEAV